VEATEDLSLVPFGQRSRPRILVRWLGAPDPTAALEELGLVLTRIESLTEVNQGDYDVLITDMMITLVGTLTTHHPAKHLWVVSVTSEGGSADQWRSDRSWVARSPGLDRSDEFSLAEDLPPRLQELAADVLAPHLLQHRRANPSFAFYEDRPTRTLGRHHPLPGVRPLAQSSGGGTLAALYPRSPASWGLVLPVGVPKIDRWVLSALQDWAGAGAPWPAIDRWQDQPRWSTANERAIAAEISAVADRRARLVAELDAKLEVLEAQAHAARLTASTGDRVLLEGKGEALRLAVAEAFRVLGYDVIDVDDGATPGNLREDLHLTDPEHADAGPVLAEVKGYDAGVRGTDLVKISRHHARAVADGMSVRAIWWIANHDRLTSPDLRPFQLQNETAVLADEHTEIGLVLVDTRDLFEQLQAVRAGLLDAATVRSSLAGSGVRWDPPPPPAIP
jgi:hypothetical protein